MKKLLFIIILLQFVRVSAQDTIKPKYSLGLNFGLNYSMMNFSPSVTQFPIQRYSGGLVFKNIVTPNAGVQIEFNYSQQGWVEIIDSSNTYKRLLDYFNLPILTHIEFGSKYSKLFINIGPTISYLYSDKEFYGITNSEANQNYYHKVIDNRLDYSVTAGIGFEQKTPIGSLMIEARVNQSLVNIFKASATGSPELSQNQYATVKFSYLFNFKPPKYKPEKENKNSEKLDKTKENYRKKLEDKKIKIDNSKSNADKSVN